MDTNKMREQFEAAYTAYCERFGWKTYTAFHMLSEVYVKESTELAWQMWQASREAVVVEIEQIRSEAKRQEDGLKEMLRRQNKKICALQGKRHD